MNRPKTVERPVYRREVAGQVLAAVLSQMESHGDVEIEHHRAIAPEAARMVLVYVDALIEELEKE